MAKRRPFPTKKRAHGRRREHRELATVKKVRRFYIRRTRQLTPAPLCNARGIDNTIGSADHNGRCPDRRRPAKETADSNQSAAKTAYSAPEKKAPHRRALWRHRCRQAAPHRFARGADHAGRCSMQAAAVLDSECGGRLGDPSPHSGVGRVTGGSHPGAALRSAPGSNPSCLRHWNLTRGETTATARRNGARTESASARAPILSCLRHRNTTPLGRNRSAGGAA